MILGIIRLDGRHSHYERWPQETVQPSMEQCHRLAEIVNKANGAGKYKFFASCREGQSHYLAKVE